jgi:hypothetical protein
MQTSLQIAEYISSLLVEAGHKGSLALYTSNLTSELDKLEIDGVFSYNDCIRVIKIGTDSYEIESSSIQATTEIVAEEEEYKFLMYGRKSKGNYKQIEIKPMKNSYVVSAIIGEILDTYPEHRGFNPKEIARNIITTISLDSTIIYITKTNRIIINIDDELYITERYDGGFAGKTKLTEQLIHKDIELLYIIMGEHHTKTTWTKDTLPQDCIYTLGNNDDVDNVDNW